MIHFFNILTIFFLALSGFFFLAGTLGMLRFPDTISRVHAPTKADNLGLGFLVLALIFQTASFWMILKLTLIWLITLVGSSAAAQLIASYNLEMQKKQKEQE